MKKLAVSLALTITAAASIAGSPGPVETQSPWLIRARAIWVKPDPSSTTISIIGGNVTHISSTVVPELDFSYFFSDNFAAELILATNRHHAVATNTALGTVDLGKVTLLPPTVTAQYHFMPTSQFSPYVGAGVNYTLFYNVNTGPVASNISYKNTWSPALQAGFDYKIDGHWSLNLDVKKLFLKPRVAVTALGLLLNTKVTINPWIVGAGVGYRV